MGVGAYFSRMLSSLVSPAVKPETRSTLAKPSPELLEALTSGHSTTSGISVNEQTALRATAVWACVRRIVEGIASLPCVIYKRVGGNGRERAVDYNLYHLLKVQPNPEMNAFTFWELMSLFVVQAGNAYAEIDYGQGFRPLALWPLSPNRVFPRRHDTTRDIVYDIYNDDGTVTTLLAYQVLHIPGMGWDGIVGFSPVRVFSESIGLALAAEEFGSRFFGNGAKPGGVLEHPGELGDKAYKRLTDDFERRHKGLANAHRIAILEEGMKYHQIQMSPDEAQFLQTREFQVADIARIYNVPLHMIFAGNGSSKNNEQNALEFVVFCLRPWIIRFEQAINTQLIGIRERKIYFAEFKLDALLRGDFAARMAGYQIARQNGWMNLDEIRALENMNPLPNGLGEIHIAPMNYTPLELMTKLVEAHIKKVAQPAGKAIEEGQSADESLPGAPDAKRFLQIMKEDIADRLHKRGVADLAAKGKPERQRAYIESATRALCLATGMESDSLNLEIQKALSCEATCQLVDIMSVLDKVGSK